MAVARLGLDHAQDRLIQRRSCGIIGRADDHAPPLREHCHEAERNEREHGSEQDQADRDRQQPAAWHRRTHDRPAWPRPDRHELHVDGGRLGPGGDCRTRRRGRRRTRQVALNRQERLGDGARRGRPLGRVLGKQRVDQLGQRRRHLGVERANGPWRVANQGHQHRHRLAAGKRELSRGQSVEHATQAEQVGAGIDRAAERLLGRHVRRSSEDGPLLSEVGAVIGGPRQAEIQDPDAVQAAERARQGGRRRDTARLTGVRRIRFARFEPEVRRLDVAVDQAARVGGGQAEGDLTADARRLADRRAVAGAQPLLQAAPAQQLHRQEWHAAVFADLVDGDDVIVLDLRRRPRLAQEALAGRRLLRLRRQHHLQGNAAVQGGILSEEDHAHAALAHELQHAIRTEPAEAALIVGREEIGPIVAGTRRGGLDRAQDRRPLARRRRHGGPGGARGPGRRLIHGGLIDEGRGRKRA